MDEQPPKAYCPDCDYTFRSLEEHRGRIEHGKFIREEACCPQCRCMVRLLNDIDGRAIIIWPGDIPGPISAVAVEVLDADTGEHVPVGFGLKLRAAPGIDAVVVLEVPIAVDGAGNRLADPIDIGRRRDGSPRTKVFRYLVAEMRIDDSPLPETALHQAPGATLKMLMDSEQPAEPQTFTVYACIGNSDDRLTQAQWAEFYKVFAARVTRAGTRIYGRWLSAPDSQYQNSCIGFEVESTMAGRLRKTLAELAAEFNQDSISWALVSSTEFLGPAPTTTLESTG